MTQEILDCLWIKALFIKSTEENILANIIDKKDLEKLGNSISKIILLENSNFFYIQDDFIRKLETIIRNKRFEGQHSQKLIGQFNEMVGAIQTYKNFSEKEKKTTISTWIQEEAEYRQLPYRKLKIYNTLDIQDMLLVDNYCMPFLLNDDNRKADCQPGDFLNAIYLLISKYPHIFHLRPDILFKCISFCMQAEDESFLISRRAQKVKTLLSNFQ